MKPMMGLGSLTDIFKPQDHEEEKILQRIGSWTVRLLEHRARRVNNLIPHETILAESQAKFGNPIGERLADLRKKHAMTQETLANKSGISQSTISKIESGQKPISPLEAKALAPLLKCSLKYLAIGKE